MGTRNLTCVVSGGAYRVAQYGQWDGYPEGQGVKILNFLSAEGNIGKLKSAMTRVRFLDPEGRDKEFVELYNKNAPEWSNDPDNRTEDQKRWFETFANRDIGGDILETVGSADDAEMLLRNSLNFAGDSLFCEWAYVVDLDKGTFEIYKGFNKKALSEEERFAGIECDDAEFKQVRHAVTFGLDVLPTEDAFLAAFESKADEDDD